MEEIEYNPKDHTYRDTEGDLVAVSKVCGSIFDAFKNVKPPVLEWAALRGSMVHVGTELFDKGTLDFEKLDPTIKPYVEGYINFIEQSDFEVLSIERMVYDRERRFAGRLDRVGKIHNQKYILDIKTSSSLSETVGLQLAAYQSCLPKDNYKRVALHLKNDTSYRLVEYDDPNDIHVFYAALVLYKWRKANGKI